VQCLSSPRPTISGVDQIQWIGLVAKSLLGWVEFGSASTELNLDEVFVA
jgi:hypothetical protein